MAAGVIDRSDAGRPDGSGPEPIPASERRLGGLDLAVLWGDLSVGVLVLFTGALLAAQMSLPAAIAAIVVGTVLGCLPLAAVSAAGARTGLPTMALFRPVLGTRGAHVPPVLNAVQLVGWAAFEFWAIARIADAVVRETLGFRAYPLWLAIAAIVCTCLAIVGPVVVVRRWLERFGIWVLIAVGVWLTVRAISAGSVSDAWNAPGGTGLSFWVGVDLVIAMPVSWLPLAADYSRFTPAPRSAFAGTYVGYALGNAWFYSLGAVLVVVAGAGVSVLGIGAAMIALGGGVAVLLALLVGETDGAFANVYSTATSIRTIAPWLPGRTTTLLVGAVAFVLAALVGTSAETFELFLLTVGSVFVPLFGVFFAFEAAGRPAAVRGADPGAIGAWAAGFAVFQWSSPSPLPAWSSGVRWLFADVAHLPFPLFDGALGASIPSALVAGAIGWIVFLRRRRQVSREPRRAGAR